MRKQCKYAYVTGEICLRKANTFLNIAISSLKGYRHGFCEYHAGYIVGLAVAALTPDDRDRGDEDGRPVKRI